MQPQSSTPTTGFVDRTCLQCGEVFSAHVSRVVKGFAKFCSVACYNASKNPVTRTCEQCGTVYHLPRCHADERQRFCSKDCRWEWHRNHRPLLTCEQCGETFPQKYRRGKQRFCSNACASTNKRGKPIDMTPYKRPLPKMAVEPVVQTGIPVPVLPQFCPHCSMPLFGPKGYVPHQTPGGRVDRICDQCGKPFRIPASALRKGPNAGRFCGRACASAWRTCVNNGVPTARFWSLLTNRDDPDACWLWNGPISMAGYGLTSNFTDQGLSRQVLVHRVVWELVNGPVAAGRVLMHQCDVRYAVGDTTYRRCANPAHLKIGTHAENYREMWERGRGIHGEKCWKTTLTAETVTEIRRRASLGERQADLARAFGISDGQVSLIVRRVTWKHLD